MKKRSLLAAVAMLIVSAVVLTSATYAWFASSATIDIAKFDATTTAATGGIVVSVDDATWKNQLTAADYTNAGGNSLIASGGSFTPVTGQVSGGAVTFKGGSLSGTTFTYTGAATSGTYIQYTTYVMSPNVDGTINVEPKLTATTGGDALAPFVYYSAVITKQSGTDTAFTTKSYTANATTDGKNYLALTGGTNPTTCQDSNGTPNGILDTTEAVGLTTAAMGPFNAFTNGDAKTALSFAAKAGVSYKIVVSVWAEGQDETCVAGAAASSAYVQLGLSLAS